jgi:hypothetical protein
LTTASEWSSSSLGFLRFHAPEVEAELEGTDPVETDLPERGEMMEGFGK